MLSCISVFSQQWTWAYSETFHKYINLHVPRIEVEVLWMSWAVECNILLFLSTNANAYKVSHVFNTQHIPNCSSLKLSFPEKGKASPFMHKNIKQSSNKSTYYLCAQQLHIASHLIVQLSYRIPLFPNERWENRYKTTLNKLLKFIQIERKKS